jgi:glyoxylase-like metal-dependent hydrolase (beta-lactamase superfamily II)
MFTCTISRHVQRTCIRNCLIALGAAFLASSTIASAQQPQIPTGGPIPDRRGFNNRINDPAAVAEVEVIVRHVAGHVYVIAGAGGNIAVQAGDDGLLLVDNNFAVFYDEIMDRIRQISEKPIRIVVNTHSHPDHVQNNANMSRQGALVYAHPNTRLAIMRQGQPQAPAVGGATAANAPPTNPNAPAPVPPAGWPTITAAEPLTFHFNGEDVLFVPLKPSHTNGDVAVYFTGSDVWAFGDVYTTDYPSIGVAQGGTIENFIDNYDMALEMTTPDTIFLPGHAQLSTRADLIANRDAISTIHDRFVEMVAQGMTLEQVRAARPSKEFDARYATENFAPNDLQNSTRWYEQMYNEAKTHLGER